MRHNDDAFTAMLLTLPLTANKDELVRPLSSTEFSILRARVAACGARRIGDLIGLDVSGIMSLLKVPEAEAYRLCMLLCRTMPLSYAMERFLEQNLDLLTRYDSAYPENLAARLGDDAPAAMYMCGDPSILSMPLVGILGISGVRMSKKAEDGLRTLVRALVREGFGIVTSSELGACRLAEAEAIECGGKVVCALAGDLMTKKDEEDSAAAIARKQMLLLSLVHPDAPYTGVHALARNRIVYALSLASFVVTTDGKRGEAEAMRRRLCDWLYVFDEGEPAGNRVIISRGATPVYDVSQMDIQKYARSWRLANAEQLSFL